MVLCPVALAVGCRKCPIFSFCPVKTVIGDVKEDEEKTPSKMKTRGAKKGR